MVLFLCDYRNLKTLIAGSGANVSEDVVKRSGATLDTIQDICSKFDEDTCVSTTDVMYQRHPGPKETKDILLGCQALECATVFSDQGR